MRTIKKTKGVCIMLIQKTQSQMGMLRPTITKTASKAAEKLGKINFDIRPNRLVAEPCRDMYAKKQDTIVAYSEGMSVCDGVWGITC